MNYHNTTQTYLRPVAHIGIRQHLQSRDVRDLLSGLVLRTVGKVAMVLLPLVLTISLFLGSAINTVDLSYSSVDNKRHELMDKNIELLAQKARLGAPDNVQQLAGKKLALFTASGDQVERLY